MISLFRRRGDRYQYEGFLSFSSLHTPIILTCVPSVFFGLITYSQFTPQTGAKVPKNDTFTAYRARYYLDGAPDA